MGNTSAKPQECDTIVPARKPLVCSKCPKFSDTGKDKIVQKTEERKKPAYPCPSNVQFDAYGMLIRPNREPEATKSSTDEFEKSPVKDEAAVEIENTSSFVAK